MHNITKKYFKYLAEIVSLTGEASGKGSDGLSTFFSCLVGLIGEATGPARIGGGGGDTVGDLTDLVELKEALLAAGFVDGTELSAVNF
jgi:hypothetical protein